MTNFIEVKRIFCFVFPRTTVDLIEDDPEDNMYLAAGVKYLITGDPHLLELASFEKIILISPASFAAE